MIKIIKRLIKLNQKEENLYEAVEQLVDHEDGNVTEIRTEKYQGNPLEKSVFDQFIIIEKEKNQLLQSGIRNTESTEMSFIKQYMQIKAFTRLKKLQKKLLGE
jgi:hypothetical protein